MSNSNLVVSTTADNEETGSTEQFFIIGDSGTGARPNTAVHRIQISVASSSAVFFVTVGRTESTANGGSDAEFFRGNQPTRTPAGLTNATGSAPSFHDVLGRYYISGGHPLDVSFEEPIEALKDWQTTTDSAFMVSLKRVDTSTSVKFAVNVWHEEY